MENIAAIAIGIAVFGFLIIAYRVFSAAWDRNASKGVYKPANRYGRPARFSTKL